MVQTNWQEVQTESKWSLAASSDIKESVHTWYRASDVVSCGQAEIGKESTCVEVPPYPKDTTAQSQSSRVV